jgi:pimeloyl-ACP methyl ester carboxylesterase
VAATDDPDSFEEFRPFASPEARKRFLVHIEMLERSWPVEYEGRMVRTDYGETFVRISGPVAAPPVVLLPGGQSSSLVWRRLIAPLSAHFRTFAVDAIYDEGRSVPVRPVHDVDCLRAWLEAVLDGLGLTDDITMAGQSYGCYASAEYALHASERLRKLIWIAPVMIGAPLSREFVDRLIPLADGRRESLAEYCRWIMPSVAARYPDEFERRIDEIILVRESYGRMIPPVRAAMMSDEDLQSIEIPTLCVLGGSDGATADPRGALERIESLMPHVQTLLVPGAGHDVVVAETDLVTRHVLDFLLL